MIECQTVKDKHEEDLTKKNGVVGVGVGHKWVNGLPQEQPAILIFVDKKRTKRGVTQKYSLNDIIPDVIDGIPTDVIEVGKIVKQAGYSQRIRPLKPGYSCGHRLITAGTIGGFFLDKDGDPVILSNNHVLSGENKAQPGDPIYQPGPYDAKTDLEFRGWNDPVIDLPYIATLKRYVILNSDGNLQDSAIATLHPKIVSGGLIDDLYPLINKSCTGFGLPTVGQQVQKFGRTTGYTTGRIIGMKASFTIGYDFGQARFNDCLVISNMSKPGDSGSVILDMEMRGVGHLFAGSPKVTIAYPLERAIQEYGLQAWNPNGVAGPTVGFGNVDWRQHAGSGQINMEKETTTINCSANQFCYLESSLSHFNSVSVTVNTGSDKGATWGPGLVIQWPTGIMKVNLRCGDRFGGYFNTTYNINIGAVKSNTDYTLRIRKSTINTYVGEVQDSGKWYTVIEIPADIFPQPPIAVRIGKTDLVGQPSNHTESGEVGSCVFKNFMRT